MYFTPFHPLFTPFYLTPTKNPLDFNKKYYPVYYRLYPILDFRTYSNSKCVWVNGGRTYHDDLSPSCGHSPRGRRSVPTRSLDCLLTQVFEHVIDVTGVLQLFIRIVAGTFLNSSFLLVCRSTLCVVQSYV